MQSINTLEVLILPNYFYPPFCLLLIRIYQSSSHSSQEAQLRRILQICQFIHGSQADLPNNFQILLAQQIERGLFASYIKQIKVSTTLRLFLLIELFTAAQMLRLSGQGQRHESLDENHEQGSDQQTPTLGPNVRLVRIAFGNSNDYFLRADWDEVTIGHKGPESIWIQIKNGDGTFSFRTQQEFGKYLTCPKHPANNQPITVEMSLLPSDNQKFIVSNVGNGLVKFQCAKNRSPEMGTIDYFHVKLMNVNQFGERQRQWSIVNA